MWHCRLPEQLLNKCVFDSLGLKKTIPGAPTDEVAIHERPTQIFSQGLLSRRVADKKVEEMQRAMRETEEEAKGGKGGGKAVAA